MTTEHVPMTLRQKLQIARACHEVNRAYCQALGDDSQKPWGEASGWQRQSALDGVEMHLDLPDAGPEMSHERWMNLKLADGWKWGPVKNADTHEHPCLVPFGDLPTEQKAKDYLFRAVVHAMRDALEEG